LTADGEVLTRLHYEDEQIIIVDCLVCHLPMAVARAHRNHFTDEERLHARSILKQILLSGPAGASHLIGPDHPIRTIPHLTEALRNLESNPDHRWVIDFEQRQIPNHPHCHLRPFSFPGTSQWEYLD